MNAIASLLQDLVRLPSVNPMGRTLSSEISLEHRVTAYLEAFFKNLGVRYERQSVAPGRENIVAYFQTSRPAPTIVFEAHQDTVPTDNMIIDPFAGRIDGNKLFGRGACDVKGGMTAMLTAFARLVRERPASACNVIMACSVDEEHTFLGVQGLAKLLKADFAVVAEPTSLDIVNAHKGIVRWSLSTTGRACHSSTPDLGVNAIYRMARVLEGIQRYAQRLSTTVVDPLLGPSTIAICVINGGSCVNIVPECCTVEVDRRLVGGESPVAAPGELLDYLRTKEGIDFPVEMAPSWVAEPPLTPAGSEALVTKLGAAIDSVKGSHRVRSVPYGTDAATLAEAGIPSVVFGPGNIDQAHTCDEWAPLDEIEQAAEILFRLACQ